MASEPDWVPEGTDTRRANVARVYDYLLGGTHNFLADQDVARTMIAVEPRAREHVRANRDFLGRAVRYLAGLGVHQFLDVGSGIPTQGNVHEIAAQAAPGSRVVYVDSDPIATAHSRMLLRDSQTTAVIEADLREPERILDHDDTRRLIETSQPTGLILCMVLHFISESEDPAGIVARLTAPMAPGSHIVISHITDDRKPDVAAALEKVYNRNVTVPGYLRSGADIRTLFGDLELLDPGVVPLPYWRPDPPGPPDYADQLWSVLCGVARKP